MAEIYSLAFSSAEEWLAVSSDKGTVHVFSLKVNSSGPEDEKLQSTSNSDANVKPFSSSLSFKNLKGKACYCYCSYFISCCYVWF